MRIRGQERGSKEYNKGGEGECVRKLERERDRERVSEGESQRGRDIGKVLWNVKDFEAVW